MVTDKVSLNRNTEKSKKSVHKALEKLKWSERMDNATDDPLKLLGPGIISYHSLLTWLFGLFLLLTLMHVPVIYHNVIGNFYEGDQGYLGGSILKSSLGNLGFS